MTDDRGAAVVEFVMVSVLLIAVFLGVVQVALTLHVRNTLIASAAEGARYGANADRTAADGAALTQQLIGSALSPSYAGEVSAGYETVGGVQAVVVRVRAEVPVIGFIDMVPTLDLRGHAFREIQGVPG